MDRGNRTSDSSSAEEVVSLSTVEVFDKASSSLAVDEELLVVVVLLVEVVGAVLVVSCGNNRLRLEASNV